MENNNKNNKLIVEFMNIEDQIISTRNIYSWNDAPFFYTSGDSKDKVMDDIVKYSKYHESWDWLMPVANEIIKSRDEQNTDSDLTDLKYALSTTNIDLVYKEVVSFIIGDIFT